MILSTYRPTLCILSLWKLQSIFPVFTSSTLILFSAHFHWAYMFCLMKWSLSQSLPSTFWADPIVTWHSSEHPSFLKYYSPGLCDALYFSTYLTVHSLPLSLASSSLLVLFLIVWVSNAQSYTLLFFPLWDDISSYAFMTPTTTPSHLLLSSEIQT